MPPRGDPCADFPAPRPSDRERSNTANASVASSHYCAHSRLIDSEEILVALVVNSCSRALDYDIEKSCRSLYRWGFSKNLMRR